MCVLCCGVRVCARAWVGSLLGWLCGSARVLCLCVCVCVLVSVWGVCVCSGECRSLQCASFSLTAPSSANSQTGQVQFRMACRARAGSRDDLQRRARQPIPPDATREAAASSCSRDNLVSSIAGCSNGTGQIDSTSPVSDRVPAVWSSRCLKPTWFSLQASAAKAAADCNGL